jgi:predicted lactoylglutathione lyase
MRMMFVNLPVKDLPASRAFFEALGFSFNPAFSNDEAACLIVAENIFVMLLTEDRFRDFITGPISDAHAATEVLTCITADSRDAVDTMLSRALAAGGRPWRPIMDHGFMYACSFQDPDGHVWEVVHMDAAAAGG